MARYQWPREFKKSTDALEGRVEHGLRMHDFGLPIGALGAFGDLRQILQAHFDNARRWMPLGPSIMTNGQAAGNPVVSGRVRDIAISPNGQRVYVASANGGVWYSKDAGASWSPVGSWALAADADREDLSLTIGALLVEFGKNGDGTDNPDLDVVYVGTGEARPGVSGTPGGKLGGLGILRLDGTITAVLADGRGNPWTREASNLSGAGVFRLARDPDNAPPFAPAGATTIVAATSTGLWARTGGFTEDSDWQRIDFTPSAFDANDGPYCSDVIWNGEGLWVALAGANAEDGIYRSTNGTAGPFTRAALPNFQQGNRLSIAASVDEQRVYVLGKTTPPPAPAGRTVKGHAYLWQIDLGHQPNGPAGLDGFDVANFPIALFASSVTVSGGNNHIFSDQADYDQGIVVDRTGASDVVYVGGSTQNGGAGWEASLFALSISGTAAAADLSTDFVAANQANPATDPTFAGGGIHADVHALKIDGSDLWVGCDGGVFRRNAAGVARSLNAGLATCEPGYIQSHPTPGWQRASRAISSHTQRLTVSCWQERRTTALSSVSAIRCGNCAPRGMAAAAPFIRPNPIRCCVSTSRRNGVSCRE